MDGTTVKFIGQTNQYSFYFINFKILHTLNDDNCTIRVEKDSDDESPHYNTC